jgi:hypothetical protein
MRLRVGFLFLALLLVCFEHSSGAAEGIAPEQIFQSVVDWNSLIGTWEVLPDDNPLDEKGRSSEKASHRVLMTLRKDGTCRIFDQDNPTGADGLWMLEDHDMSVTFKDGHRVDFFVYGIKRDFMVTRSPIKQGRDQLWSRVK